MDIPLIIVLRRPRQVDLYEFKTILVYTASSRPANIVRYCPPKMRNGRACSGETFKKKVKLSTTKIN